MKIVRSVVEISERRDKSLRGQILVGRNANGEGVYAPIAVPETIEAIRNAGVGLKVNTRHVAGFAIPTWRSPLLDADIEERGGVVLVTKVTLVPQVTAATAFDGIAVERVADVTVAPRRATAPLTPAVEAE